MNKLSMLSMLLSFLIGCNYAAASDSDSESLTANVSSDESDGGDSSEDSKLTSVVSSDSGSSSDSDVKELTRKSHNCVRRANKESRKCTEELNQGLHGDSGSEPASPKE
ncbi:MAG: hypothetical protein LBB34_00100 [Holosporales bacterium]|jgi:hypothetical protein|nr:hypothetical protein [Holosporales bacterium]